VVKLNACPTTSRLLGRCRAPGDRQRLASQNIWMRKPAGAGSRVQRPPRSTCSTPSKNHLCTADHHNLKRIMEVVARGGSPTARVGPVTSPARRTGRRPSLTAAAGACMIAMVAAPGILGEKQTR
jgi:hypothetical protein